MNQIQHNPNEIVAIVDQNDKIIGEAIRQEVHLKGLWHRESCVYLINFQRQVLLQKRTDNHKWDHSSSGHFPTGEEYKDGALRELKEELGIRIKKDELQEIAKEKISITSHSGLNNRFIKIFVVEKDIKINNLLIDDEEIEEIKYFDFDTLRGLSSIKDVMTGAARYIIEKYIIKRIKLD